MNQNEDKTNEDDFFELYQDLFEAMMKGMQEFINNNPSIMTNEPYFNEKRVFAKPKKQTHQNIADETSKFDESKQSLKKTFDLFNTKKEIWLTIEIPNVKKKHMDLSVTRKTITIRLNRNGKTVEKKIPLPSPVKQKTTKASYKNGILDIIIQKEGNGIEIKPE